MLDLAKVLVGRLEPWARLLLRFDETEAEIDCVAAASWRLSGIRTATFSGAIEPWLRRFLADAEHDLRLLQHQIGSSPDRPADEMRVRAVLQLAHLHLVFEETDAAVAATLRAERLIDGLAGSDAEAGRTLADLLDDVRRYCGVT